MPFMDIAHCRSFVHAFAGTFVNVNNADTFAYARRRIRVHIWKFTLSVCVGLERYYALSWRHL